MSNKFNLFFYLFAGAILISTILVLFNLQAKINNIVKTQPNTSAQISDLNKNITKIDIKLENLSKDIDCISNRFEKLSTISQNDKKSTKNDLIYEYLISANNKLYKLEDILSASGIIAFSTNQNIDPSLLADLCKEQFADNQEEVYREEMRTLASKQKKEDINLYGKEFKKDLHSSQKYNRRNNPDDVNAKIDDFINTYPDSYAAATFIPLQNKGLKSDLEENYNKLKNNQKYSQAVHLMEGQMKPIVSVQQSLVKIYISEKNYTQAENILRDMEKYSNERTWYNYRKTILISDLVKKLRERMK